MVFGWIGLALLLSLLALRGDRARRAYWRQWRQSTAPGPLPAATLIVPVKGMDEGLRENLASLAAQDYPDYELLVTVRDPADLPPGVLPPHARLVIAGEPEPGTGEKITNLLAAVASARPASAVLVFADSDGSTAPPWLRFLVTRLEEPGTGAATGYRWHLPHRPDLPSLLRSVWNGVIAGGMGPGGAAFCWGGATAIRRTDFQRWCIPDWWRGAISDDYRLSAAVRAAGRTIAFAPGAMVASTDHCTWGELFEWTRRQMQITRFHAPKLWGLALAAHVLYCGAMVAGIALLLQGQWIGAAALSAQLLLGYLKATHRIRMVAEAMPEHASWFHRWGWLHVLLTPLGTWLWLYASIAAGLFREIVWRGRRHRLG